jgi:hypothetical protein
MSSLHVAELVSIGLGGALVGLVGAIGYRAWKASRVTPEERERRRRAMLVAIGKMGDATLMEIREEFLFYGYQVRGAEYTASQDVSALRDKVPGDLSLLSALSVRYDPRNPANSIVVAEEWSGLHMEGRPSQSLRPPIDTETRRHGEKL